MSEVTAPPINRSPMLARPWFGFWHGLLFALWPGLRWTDQSPFPGDPAWLGAARRRRRVLLAIVAVIAISAAALGDAAGIDPGVPLVLVTLLLSWVAVGLVTAGMGAWVLWRGDPHALPLPGADGAQLPADARTALVMPICNEDIGTVFGGLRATCESLAATGAGGLFDVFVLSDTADPALRRAEIAAWRTLRASLGDGPGALGSRVFYRVRRRRSERKAGNVSDFCRRWGADYRYMVVLDADSTMSGDALVTLVRLMEQQPRAGILQTLPQPIGHDTLHARAQQFGTRVTGRLFSLGMAYWQLGESHYWGHNAILRVAPFMAHCRMGHLPGSGGLSGPILSHDFVEAAMMRRAGYEVWVLPTLEGSWEQAPPNLLDELQRDRRWCQGNLQNARLIAEPGWAPAHRVMFATGALSYLTAPLWLALLATGVLWSRRGELVTGAGVALWSLTLAVLLLPRLLGVAAVLLTRRQAAHGGTARMLASTAMEALLSALQAPVRMLAHSSYVLGALTGLRLEWRSPPRDAREVAWSDALARIGLLTLPVAVLLVIAQPAAREGALTWLPILLPLLFAVPMAVATGSSRWGGWLRRQGLMLVAEERRPPRPLRQARRNAAFAALQPPAPSPSAGVSRLPTPAWVRGAWAAGVAACLMVALVPRAARGPELQTGSWIQAAPTVSGHTLRVLDMTLTAAVHPIDPEPPRRVRRNLPNRPAAYIDDAVRQRAMRAVEAALASAGEATS